MNRHGYFVLAAMLLLASGCSDEASSTVGEACVEADSQPYCDAAGKLAVCKNGFWSHDACSFGDTCVNDRCVKKCVDIIGNQCPDGTVCDVDKKICQEPSKISCDEESYQAVCDKEGLRIYCLDGTVHHDACAKGTCEEGRCVSPDACSEDTFVPKCDNGKQVVCEDGELVSKTCTGDTVCKDGYCLPELCDEERFTPYCAGVGATTACRGTTVNAVPCADYEKCLNGICQKNLSCDAEDKDKCLTTLIAQACVDGVWVKTQCDVVDEVCNSGHCVPKGSVTACDPMTYKPSCDGHVALKCLMNSIQETPCSDDEKCEEGECVKVYRPGDDCSTTFTSSCFDEDNLLVCLNGTVTTAPCGNASCVAGKCVDKTCDESTKAVCDAEGRVVTKCVDGKLRDFACSENQTCRDGACVDTAEAGDLCDPATFKASCSVNGEIISCVPTDEDPSKGSINIAYTCSKSEFCSDGRCVECLESTFEPTCVDGQTVVCQDGKKVMSSCPDKTFCSSGACVECDSTYKPACVDSSTHRFCKNGSIVTEACADDEMCTDVSHSCQPKGDHCDTGHPCADHYTCADGVCVFVPECTLGSDKICSSEKNAVLTCEAPGLYAELPCSDDQKCVDGMCKGTQCDEAIYGTQCQDSKVTVCANGYIVTSHNCADQYVYNACDDTRYNYICRAGACIACDHETFTPSCYTYGGSSNYYFKCSDADKFVYGACAENETGVPNKGCVSKCGEGFTRTCKDDNTVHDCSAEGGEVDIPCAFHQKCEDGACVTRIGDACTPASFQKKCYDSSVTETVPILETCDEETNTVHMYQCTAPDSFCGTINGEVDCYDTCTPGSASNNFFCSYSPTLHTAHMSTCVAGTDVTGRTQYGSVPIASACDANGIQITCHYDTVNNSPAFDYNLCSYTSSGTCSASTKQCTTHTLCSGPSDSRCEGTVAKSCVYDPAVGAYVLQTTDCSDTLNAPCVTYTNQESNKVAVCNKSVEIGGLDISTLGTCSADRKTLHKIVGFYVERTSSGTTTHSYSRNYNCSNECTTATNADVTYAYCH